MSTFKRTLSVLTASIFLATGCAQMRSVPLASGAPGVERPGVQAGDRVVVTTRDGAKHKFRVTSVESDVLRGEQERIAYTDMKTLHVQTPGGGINKTALIVGAVVLGAAVIGAASGGSGGGGGY